MREGQVLSEVMVGCSPGRGQLSVSDLEAIELFRADVAAGKDWYQALLQAIALWSGRHEAVDGRVYVYLIGGEAFDWLALAERLLLVVDGAIPAAEREALLGHGRPPRVLPEAEFKRLIGSSKHSAYLNYFYGITVEEALQRAVEGEVRKERRCRGLVGDRGVTREAFGRIYGGDQDELLAQFRRQRSLAPRRALSPTDRKELLYWLFKYRVANNEQARVASDTKKGLRQLERGGWHSPIAASPDDDSAPKGAETT